VTSPEETSAEWPENPFWNFSISFYGGEGVASLLLKFQDDWQADVNLLLYCCWAGWSGAPRFTEAEMSALCQVVLPWQSEIIQPLRGLRRTLKQDARGGPRPWVETVRGAIQSAELAAEQLQQFMLYSSTPLDFDSERDQEERRRNTVSNLALYMTQLGSEPDSWQMESINCLADLMFEHNFEIK